MLSYHIILCVHAHNQMLSYHIILCVHAHTPNVIVPYNLVRARTHTPIVFVPYNLVRARTHTKCYRTIESCLQSHTIQFTLIMCSGYSLFYCMSECVVAWAFCLFSGTVSTSGCIASNLGRLVNNELERTCKEMVVA